MLSHTIVQKLNGLKYISPLLQSTNSALQNSAVALLGNLSRSTRTNTSMGKRCVHRSRRRPLLLWLLVFDCIGLVLLVLSLCGMLSLCLMNVFVGEARQTLPQLVGFLNSGLKQDDTSAGHDSTMATALHSAHALLRADPEIGKSLLNNSLVNSLFSMSSNL